MRKDTPVFQEFLGGGSHHKNEINAFTGHDDGR